MTTSTFEIGLWIGIFIGGIVGGAIVLWMVIALNPKSQFAYFDKSCIISDLGPQWQVDCPPQQ